MAVNVTFNGQVYSLPSTGDMSWGTQVTAWCQDVSANAVTASIPQTLSGKLILAQPGAVTAPAFSFLADADTGMYQPAVGQLALSTNGVQRLLIDASGNLTAAGTITAGSLIGSLSSPTITTPAITGGTATNLALTTPAITGGTITNTAHSGGTITSATLTSCTSSTALPVGGNGVSYSGVTGTGAGHTHAWGWTGSQLQAWVDGTNVGNVALGSYLPLTGGTITGTLTASGVVRSPQFVVNTSGGYLYSDATYCYYVQDGSNWQWRYTRANGRMSYVRGDGVELFVIDPSGNLSSTSSYTSGGNVYCQTLQASNGVFATNDNAFGLYTSGTNRVQQYQPNWYWGWDIGTGQLNWVANSTVFWVMRPSDSLCYNNIGKVAGHGAYADLSDAKLKENVAEADHGLTEILQLQPKTFNRKSRVDDSVSDTTELGFVAQDVREVLPEAVSDLRLDGEELLAVSTTPIIAALVNAVKELAQEVAALKRAARS